MFEKNIWKMARMSSSKLIAEKEFSFDNSHVSNHIPYPHVNSFVFQKMCKFSFYV